MTSALITAGKASWVGSGAPNKTHHQTPRLKVRDGEQETFVKLRTPVPPGDTVASAVLRLTLVDAEAGTLTFTVKRTSKRVDWSDLTWNNKPGVTGAAATDTVTDPTADQVLEFDVTAHLQTVSGGARFHGWKLTTDAATTARVHGFDSDHPPTLEVTYYADPATPTDLAPAGVVSLAKPHLMFTAPDVTGDDEVAAVQVQIDSAPVVAADGSWTSPDFDSGEVAATEPELDLAATAYAGLADTASTQWHVRWKSTSGAWSGWSDGETITRKVKPVITITNPPAAPAVVTEPTPPFIATVPTVPESWRMTVVETADPTRVHARSGRRSTISSTLSWTPDPADRLQDDGAYTLVVDVWDGEDRSASPGDPTYAQATRAFTVAEEATVTAPVLVSVAEDDDLPLALLTFTRATAPDSFTVYRDGVLVRSDLDPAEILVSGSTYEWRDPAHDPYAEHTYAVRAVVNGDQSPKSNAVTATIRPTGVWLISQDRQRHVVLRGDGGIDGWGVEDDVALYRVHGRSQLVQIRASLGALGGSFTGTLYPDDRPLDDARADLAAMRQADEPVILVAADYAALVRLRNVTDSVHPDSLETRIMRRVGFEFIESDT